MAVGFLRDLLNQLAIFCGDSEAAGREGGRC